MNETDYWKAKGLIKRKEIELTYSNPVTDFFIFEIKKDNILITKTKKGWLCDAMERDEEFNKRLYWAKKHNKKLPTRWGCVFNQDGECIHCQAAKLLLDSQSKAGQNLSTSNAVENFGSPRPLKLGNDAEAYANTPRINLK